LNKL
jgi:putative sterol carrier protein